MAPKLFYKTFRRLMNSNYGYITLVPKPNKYIHTKRYYRLLSLMNTDDKFLQQNTYDEYKNT